MISRDPVTSLVEALASGGVEIVDLTQPLNERTPIIQLPEQFEQTPGLKVREISRYDERGPAWAWNWLEIGEHVGTHFDAPIHWITGRGGLDVSQVPPPSCSAGGRDRQIHREYRRPRLPAHPRRRTRIRSRARTAARRQLVAATHGLGR